MALIDDPRPPLPDWITDAYNLLSSQMTDAATDTDASIPAIDHDQAIALLESSTALDLERGDATHAITRLLDRGYLYKVGTELRLTTSPDH